MNVDNVNFWLNYPFKICLTASIFIMSVFCLIALSFFYLFLTCLYLKQVGKKSACAMRQNTLIKVLVFHAVLLLK